MVLSSPLKEVTEHMHISNNQNICIAQKYLLPWSNNPILNSYKLMSFTTLLCLKEWQEVENKAGNHLS